MPKKQPWYVEERLKALAVVWLTERDDLHFTKQPEDHGLDYIVEIRPDGKPTGRIFGLQLLLLEKELSRPKDVPSLQDLPFPLCIFAFSIDGSKARYAWDLEPVLTAEGEPKLRPTGFVTGFDTLDKEALDRIVEQVNAWYDASRAHSKV